MKKTLLSLSIVLSLSACSVLEKNSEKVIEPAARFIHNYCIETDVHTRDTAVIPKLNAYFKEWGGKAHIDKSICIGE
jgi:hypothetical protein